MMTTFFASNSASSGGGVENGWHSWPNLPRPATHRQTSRNAARAPSPSANDAPLAERVRVAIDVQLDRVREPVGALRERLVGRVPPLHGVVQQLRRGVHAVHDLLDDRARERAGARFGVQAALGLGGVLRPDDLRMGGF